MELTELKHGILDRLQHCKDIGGVKNIKQLKFSPSGHMVAAANSREILIICAYTWKIKATLKGHTGSVTALGWSHDSIYITSAGLDGAIYGWFLDGYQRYLEYVVKGSVYSCLLVDQQRTFIIACGPSLPVKVIDTDKKLISHGKEFSVIGEELLVSPKESKDALEGAPGTSPPTPESTHSPRSSSVSPTSEDPIVSQPQPIKVDGTKEGPPGSLLLPHTLVLRKRDSTVPTEENPEGSWVQHKFRSNCMFELTHEKPVTLMAGLFKAGVLMATVPGGELRMYAYPFQRDAPNLLKEVVLLTTGDITGLCVDEDRRLIFACTTQGSIFISTIDLEVVGPKVEDPYEEEKVAMQEVIPVIPGIVQYLKDTGTDALNILLERDEVEEMKRDLEELKLTMAREVKDASFRAQRAALEWATGMKEREAGYLERAKEYELQVKLLSHNLHLAVSDKETAIQDLLNAQRSSIQQLEEFYQNKLAQELERSHISRKQFQKDLVNLEMEMKDKEQIYLEKMVELENGLKGADAAAEAAIKKVRDECNQVNEHYKMEMEEDLLLSDEELNKALEKLNADVNVEKERADENFEQLLLQKRHVMQVEKKMKDLQAVHTEHVELIEKLSSENAELKKTVMELDYEKRILKKVVLLTDQKTQHLVHERKDQETKTIVRDFKIQQLRKREQPLEREVAKLRFQLGEMERHQLSHVMEMKHQMLIVDNLKARLGAMDEDNQKLADQLHERESYVDMFTRALCQLVQEHDVSEWPQLTRQLYFNYVKDVRRTETLDHLDAFGQVMHQRENLEKFVAILQREIGRSEMRNWRETHKFMQQNLDMLHEYNEAQRNVRRLAFMTQKLQGDVVYWKALAAKPERRLRPTREYMSPSKASPQLDNNQSQSISRCSKSTRKSTPSNRIRASFVSSAELSRASSPGINEAQMSAQEERFKEQFRSSTPVAHILKPYLHRGTIAAAATQRYSFIQNRPWSPEPQSDKEILDLNILINDMRKELRKKDEIIEQLQKNSSLSATCNYLPGTRSQSLFETSSSEERVSRSPGVQFSPSLFEDMCPADETTSRRPKSVPTLSFGSPKNMATTRSPFLSGEKLSVPRSAMALDIKLSSDLDKVEEEMIPRSTSPTGPVPSFARRASSLTGGLSTIMLDGGSLNAGADGSPPSRRSLSPPGLNHPPIQPLDGINLRRRASSPVVCHPTSNQDVNLLRRSSSPGPGPSTTAHPRILSLQIENSSLIAEKITGVVEAHPTMSPTRRRSLSPPNLPEVSSPDLEVEGRVPQTPTATLDANLNNSGSEQGPLAPAFHRRKSSLMNVEMADSVPVNPPEPIPRRKSTLVRSLSPPMGTTLSPAIPVPIPIPEDSLPDSGSEAVPQPSFNPGSPSFDQAPGTPFHRRKSSFMKVETADSVPEALLRKKSILAKVGPVAGASSSSGSGIERRSSTFMPPGVNTQRRKSSRFETTFLGSQVQANISELRETPSTTPTRKQSVTVLSGGANNTRKSSIMNADGTSSSSPNLRRRPSSMNPPARQSTVPASAAVARTYTPPEPIDSPATSTQAADLAPQTTVAADPDASTVASPPGGDKSTAELPDTAEQAP